MTDYQNELVMEHLDLVNWVIRTRISVPNRPLLTYDDFYAIGCEAICRAALKYQADSGEFAPFACRYTIIARAKDMIHSPFLHGFGFGLIPTQSQIFAPAQQMVIGA